MLLFSRARSEFQGFGLLEELFGLIFSKTGWDLKGLLKPRGHPSDGQSDVLPDGSLG